MLEFIEETFDAVAFGIESEVTMARVFAVGSRRDDGLCIRRRNTVNDFLTIVSFIGKNGFGRKVRQQRLCLRII